MALEDGWQCSVSALESDSIERLRKDSEDHSAQSSEENSEQLETLDFGEDVLSEQEEEEENCSRNLRKRKIKETEKPAPVLICPVCLDSFCKQETLKRHLLKFHQVPWKTYAEAIKVDSEDLKCVRDKISESLKRTFADLELCCICQLPISLSGRSRREHLRCEHDITMEEYNTVLSMSEEERQGFLEEKSAKRKENKSSEFCGLCNKYFSTLSVHTTHVRTMHPNNTQMLLDLEKKRSAYNTSTIVMQCPLCTEQRNGKAIFRHFKDLHGKHSDYVAMQKELTDKYKEQHLAHERNRYRDKLLSRTANCKFCEKEFPHRWARARHQSKCPANPNPTKLHHCSICMRSYTTREKLDAHIKVTLLLSTFV